MRVGISSRVLEQIMDSAAADRNEVCGLLLGGEGRIDAALPAANVAPDPARHFELDPVALIAAHRAARAGGPAIIGHYHSHPGGHAMPSATDAASARPDGMLWLIVAENRARLWIAGSDSNGDTLFEEASLSMCD